ncbi:hypothetical protein LJC72_11540, partial [Bacteroides sp. OttesenSCG-928-D19]|nr:hypothetical protein [Bacteroides sp. OttesenSCG-928-D19]
LSPSPPSPSSARREPKRLLCSNSQKNNKFHCRIPLLLQKYFTFALYPKELMTHDKKAVNRFTFLPGSIIRADKYR